MWAASRNAFRLFVKFVDVWKKKDLSCTLPKSWSRVAFLDVINAENDLSRQFRVTLFFRNPKSVKNFLPKSIFKVGHMIFAGRREIT